MLRHKEFEREPATRSLYRPTRILGVVVLGVAVALGGCSADVLRADAPAFGLNGDAVPGQRTAVAGESSDFDQRIPRNEPETGTLERNRGLARASGNAGPRAPYSGAPDPGAPRSANLRSDNLARLEDDAAAENRETSSAHSQKPRFAGVTPGAPVAITNRSISDRSTSNQEVADQDYTPVATGSLPTGRSITVEAGDTLYQLSRRYGVSVDALRNANGLTNNVIRPGQSLVLPGAGAARSVATVRPPRRRARPTANGATYTVRPGDSLYGISRRTGVSVAALQQLNGITDVRALRPGTDLVLRRGGSAEPSRQTQTTMSRPAAPSALRPTQPPARVASRTNFGAQPLIKAKPIKTVPITRSGLGRNPASEGNATPQQPRILNQRPTTPIATRPKQTTAMVAPPAHSRKPAQSERFDWPAKGRLIARFNHSGQGVKNDGINIALDMGADVKAAGEGVVAYAGSELKGYGNLVLLRHDNGWVSAYAHASQILVKRGDRVSRGQIIAKAGRSGDVTQPQLHFELRKGAKPVDPLPYLASQ